MAEEITITSISDEQIAQWRAESRAKIQLWRAADHIHVAAGRDPTRFRGWKETITAAQRIATNAHWARIDEEIAEARKLSDP